MSNHIMHAFDNDLKELEASIFEMGKLACEAIELSIKALMTNDVELAKAVRANDKRIDAMQHDIEDKGTLTIAKRQPMANDLRAVVGTFRVAHDIERVADLAKNIAKRVVTIQDNETLPRVPMGFETLGRLVVERLNAVLDAYVANDTEAALAVWKADDDIDAGYGSLFRELLTYMVENPKNITACAHLLFCAKNIERMGDHATNIAENIWYVEKGEILGDDRPRG
jgi:phosphate transport system protein